MPLGTLVSSSNNSTLSPRGYGWNLYSRDHHNTWAINVPKEAVRSSHLRTKRRANYFESVAKNLIEEKEKAKQGRYQKYTVTTPGQIASANPNTYTVILSLTSHLPRDLQEFSGLETVSR